MAESYLAFWVEAMKLNLENCLFFSYFEVRTMIFFFREGVKL